MAGSLPWPVLGWVICLVVTGHAALEDLAVRDEVGAVVSHRQQLRSASQPARRGECVGKTPAFKGEAGYKVDVYPTRNRCGVEILGQDGAKPGFQGFAASVKVGLKAGKRYGLKALYKSNCKVVVTLQGPGSGKYDSFHMEKQDAQARLDKVFTPSKDAERIKFSCPASGDFVSLEDIELVETSSKKKLIARPEFEEELSLDTFADPKQASRGKKPKGSVDCVVGDWESWMECKKSSGLDWEQIRARKVITKPANGGLRCPATSMTRPCKAGKAEITARKQFKIPAGTQQIQVSTNTGAERKGVLREVKLCERVELKDGVVKIAGSKESVAVGNAAKVQLSYTTALEDATPTLAVPDSAEAISPKKMKASKVLNSDLGTSYDSTSTNFKLLFKFPKPLSLVKIRYSAPKGMVKMMSLFRTTEPKDGVDGATLIGSWKEDGRVDSAGNRKWGEREFPQNRNTQAAYYFLVNKGIHSDDPAKFARLNAVEFFSYSDKAGPKTGTKPLIILDPNKKQCDRTHRGQNELLGEATTGAAEKESAANKARRLKAEKLNAVKTVKNAGMSKCWQTCKKCAQANISAALVPVLWDNTNYGTSYSACKMEQICKGAGMLAWSDRLKASSADYMHPTQTAIGLGGKDIIDKIGLSFSQQKPGRNDDPTEVGGKLNGIFSNAWAPEQVVDGFRFALGMRPGQKILVVVGSSREDSASHGTFKFQEKSVSGWTAGQGRIQWDAADAAFTLCARPHVASVDCKVSKWSKWSDPSPSADPDEAKRGRCDQNRTRSVKSQPIGMGEACPHLTESKTTFKCTVAPKAPKLTKKNETLDPRDPADILTPVMRKIQNLVQRTKTEIETAPKQENSEFKQTVQVLLSRVTSARTTIWPAIYKLDFLAKKYKKDHDYIKTALDRAKQCNCVGPQAPNSPGQARLFALKGEVNKANGKVCVVKTTPDQNRIKFQICDRPCTTKENLEIKERRENTAKELKALNDAVREAAVTDKEIAGSGKKTATAFAKEKLAKWKRARELKGPDCRPLGWNMLFPKNGAKTEHFKQGTTNWCCNPKPPPKAEKMKLEWWKLVEQAAFDKRGMQLVTNKLEEVKRKMLPLPPALAKKAFTLNKAIKSWEAVLTTMNQTLDKANFGNEMDTQITIIKPKMEAVKEESKAVLIRAEELAKAELAKQRASIALHTKAKKAGLTQDEIMAIRTQLFVPKIEPLSGSKKPVGTIPSVSDVQTSSGVAMSREQNTTNHRELESTLFPGKADRYPDALLHQTTVPHMLPASKVAELVASHKPWSKRIELPIDDQELVLGEYESLNEAFEDTPHNCQGSFNSLLENKTYEDEVESATSSHSDVVEFVMTHEGLPGAKARFAVSSAMCTSCKCLAKAQWGHPKVKKCKPDPATGDEVCTKTAPNVLIHAEMQGQLEAYPSSAAGFRDVVVDTQRWFSERAICLRDQLQAAVQDERISKLFSKCYANCGPVGLCNTGYEGDSLEGAYGDGKVVTDSVACAKACQDQARCEAWVYNQEGKTCTLMALSDDEAETAKNVGFSGTPAALKSVSEWGSVGSKKAGCGACGSCHARGTGKNLPGPYAKGLVVGSACQCEEACVKNSACLSWEFESNNQKCFLKAAGKTEFSVGSIGGSMSQCSTEGRCHSEFQGDAVLGYENGKAMPSIAACTKACGDLKECSAWSFNKAELKCFLRESDATPSFSLSYVGALKKATAPSSQILLLDVSNTPDHRKSTVGDKKQSLQNLQRKVAAAAAQVQEPSIAEKRKSLLTLQRKVAAAAAEATQLGLRVKEEQKKIQGHPIMAADGTVSSSSRLSQSEREEVTAKLKKDYESGAAKEELVKAYQANQTVKSLRREVLAALVSARKAKDKMRANTTTPATKATAAREKAVPVELGECDKHDNDRMARRQCALSLGAKLESRASLHEKETNASAAEFAQLTKSWEAMGDVCMKARTLYDSQAQVVTNSAHARKVGNLNDKLKAIQQLIALNQSQLVETQSKAKECAKPGATEADSSCDSGKLAAALEATKAAIKQAVSQEATLVKLKQPLVKKSFLAHDELATFHAQAKSSCRTYSAVSAQYLKLAAAALNRKIKALKANVKTRACRDFESSKFCEVRSRAAGGCVPRCSTDEAKDQCKQTCGRCTAADVDTLDGCKDKKPSSTCKSWQTETVCANSSCSIPSSKRFCKLSCKQCSPATLQKRLEAAQQELVDLLKQSVPKPAIKKTKAPKLVDYVMTALVAHSVAASDVLDSPSVAQNDAPTRFSVRAPERGCELQATLSASVCNECEQCADELSGIQQQTTLVAAEDAAWCRSWYVNWNKVISHETAKYTPYFLRPKISQCAPCHSHDQALANGKAVMDGWTGVNGRLNARYYSLCEAGQQFERNVPPKCCATGANAHLVREL